MKKLHKRILAHLFLISLSLSLSVPLIADPGAPGSDPAVGASGGQFVSGDASGVPLDGGIIEILVAGAALAGMRAMRKRGALSVERGAGSGERGALSGERRALSVEFALCPECS